MLEDFLLQVNKPGRYIGCEWNVSGKDFDKSNIRFALCFPDLYEVGMSNLGIRIVYGILNSIPDVVCERFFSVDIDMENILRSNHQEIFSLESKKRLKEFDIIGFSLGHELSYSNVLDILDLGGIPLEASLRNHTYPLVIGGGPAVLNPESLHAFFDLFVIGEAEEVILEIIDLYRKFKDKFKVGKISKQDLLMLLSGLEGVYVPSLYEAIYDSKGKLKEFKPKTAAIPTKIRKRFVKDLNNAYFPLEWLLPYIQIVHDRISLEIMRGCPNSCRFCQARHQYFPLRIRSMENILNLACRTYRNTGYEELSLSGLSVSDYPGIKEVTKSLIDLFREKGISVSLPSIKPKVAVGNLSRLIASIRKTTFTFAPEAATERLRKILNKDFDVEEFFKVIEEAYTCGWQHIKLYFMIGLPDEKQEDLDAIIDLSLRVSELRRKANKGPAQVNISINTLIPKPHTPFQWLAMQDLDTIKDKQDYLKEQKIKNKKLRLSFHNRYMSFLEGVLSRGDRRLSKVILSAFKKGARFDAWANYFSFDKWQDAFTELKIDPNFYLQEKSKNELLPWDFLDLGINKEILISDFNEIPEKTIQ